MKLLAIETSTELCSVAILQDDEIIHREKHAPKQHTQLILPMVDELLGEAQLSLNQLDGLAFSAGPGSFTGIRLAAGIIQGLAHGADLSVAMVSTLAVLAQGAYRRFSYSYILPALDAKMHQVYWGAYQIKSGLAEPMIDDSVCDPDKIIIPEKQNWIGVGSGWLSYSKIFSDLLGKGLQKIIPDLSPEAQDVLPLAQKRFREGQTVEASQALPIYLRDRVV